MIKLAIAVLLLAASPALAGTIVLLPTSAALRIARHALQAESYSSTDRQPLEFDVISNRDGRPFLTGYVTFNFLHGGDTVATIAVNERTGLAVDPMACLLFNTPATQADRIALQVNGEPPGLLDDLKAQSGCDSFRTINQAVRTQD